MGMAWCVRCSPVEWRALSRDWSKKVIEDCDACVMPLIGAPRLTALYIVLTAVHYNCQPGMSCFPLQRVAIYGAARPKLARDRS